MSAANRCLDHRVSLYFEKTSKKTVSSRRTVISKKLVGRHSTLNFLSNIIFYLQIFNYYFITNFIKKYVVKNLKCVS